MGKVYPWKGWSWRCSGQLAFQIILIVKNKCLVCILLGSCKFPSRSFHLKVLVSLVSELFFKFISNIPEKWTCRCVDARRNSVHTPVFG